MKKSFSLILALVLIFSLFAGCGKDKASKAKVTTISNSEDTIPSESTSASSKGDAVSGSAKEAAIAAFAKEPVATAKPDLGTAAARPDSSASSLKPDTNAPNPNTDTSTPSTITTGTWTGDVFTNPWSGITFTCPSKWTKSTDDEIASMMGITGDLIGEDMMKVAELVSVYDFMVSDPSGSNIILMYENLQLEGATSYSPADYLDTLKSQMSLLEGSLGVTYTSDKIKPVTVDGKEYSELDFDISGIMNQYYLCRRVGNYMACIIITSTDGSDASDYVKYFG